MQALATYTHSHSLFNSSSTPVSKPLNMQRAGTRYWKVLVDKGVPSGEARELAIAIINFVYLDSPLSPHQKHLISRYYRHISTLELLSLQFC